MKSWAAVQIEKNTPKRNNGHSRFAALVTGVTAPSRGRVAFIGTQRKRQKAKEDQRDVHQQPSSAGPVKQARDDRLRGGVP